MANNSFVTSTNVYKKVVGEKYPTAYASQDEDNHWCILREDLTHTGAYETVQMASALDELTAWKEAAMVAEVSIVQLSPTEEALSILRSAEQGGEEGYQLSLGTIAHYIHLVRENERVKLSRMDQYEQITRRGKYA